MLNNVHVCPNDCVVYVGELKDKDVCPRAQCALPRFKTDILQRKSGIRSFSYCSVKNFLEARFKCSNIAQVMTSYGGAIVDMQQQTVIKDITETTVWKKWTQGEKKIVLALNTDGVNPFHSQNVQYSFWPIIMTIMNLPPHVRTKHDALFLYGIVPSRRDRDGGGIEPNLNIYQELLISELIKLSSLEIYSAYTKAPLNIKVELLMYMLDYQAYAKYFHMTGAASYMACNLCLWKGTYSATSKKMLMLGHGTVEEPAMRDFAVEASYAIIELLLHVVKDPRHCSHFSLFIPNVIFLLLSYNTGKCNIKNVTTDNFLKKSWFQTAMHIFISSIV